MLSQWLGTETPNEGRQKINALIELISETGLIAVAAGAPSDANGENGTYYLDSTNGDFYQKSSDTWGSPVANLGNPDAAGSGLVHTAKVFVAEVGNDADDGTEVNAPKLTLGSAVTQASALITAGADAVRIEVMDGGTYTEASTLVVPEYVSVVAPGATYEGAVTVSAFASFEIGTHYATTDGQRMVNRNFTSDGPSFYRARISDGRGSAGTVQNTMNVQNAGGAAKNMFVEIGLMYVAQNGEGIQDETGTDAGHIHFTVKDIYLAGSSSKAIRAASATSNIIGYIDHILETGSPLSTEGIVVLQAGAEVKVTADEIIADTAYRITAGDLYLVCPKITGTRTGTPVLEVSEHTYLTIDSWVDEPALGWIDLEEGDVVPLGDDSEATGDRAKTIAVPEIRRAVNLAQVYQPAHGFATPYIPMFWNGTEWEASLASDPAKARVQALQVAPSSVDWFVLQFGGEVFDDFGVLAGALGMTLYLQDAGGIGAVPGTITVPVMVPHQSTKWLFTPSEAPITADALPDGVHPEALDTNAASGAAATIDLDAGTVFDITLTANCTFSFSNVPTEPKGVTLILTQDGTGSRTVTWPASVKWAGGTAPTLSTAASAVDVITLFTSDGGTTWYGFEAGLDFS